MINNLVHMIDIFNIVISYIDLINFCHLQRVSTDFSKLNSIGWLSYTHFCEEVVHLRKLMEDNWKSNYSMFD